MTEGLQETIDAITEVLNNKIHPPEWEMQIISILKPIDWANIPDDTLAQDIPAWKAYYRKINGVWIFQFLLDSDGEFKC